MSMVYPQGCQQFKGDIKYPHRSYTNFKKQKQSQNLRCRICLSEEDQKGNNKLVSFCDCKGSVGLIHRACLCCWQDERSDQIFTEQSINCEICKKKIPLQILYLKTCQSQLNKPGYKPLFIFFMLIFATIFGALIYQITNVTFILNNPEQIPQQAIPINCFILCLLLMLLLSETVFIVYKFFVKKEFRIQTQQQNLQCLVTDDQASIHYLVQITKTSQINDSLVIKQEQIVK